MKRTELLPEEIYREGIENRKAELRYKWSEIMDLILQYSYIRAAHGNLHPAAVRMDLMIDHLAWEYAGENINKTNLLLLL